MRLLRLRWIVIVVVLVAAGFGGWYLLPSDGGGDRAITVGTTDKVTSLDPAGAYDAGSWALYSNLFQSLLTFEPGAWAPVPDAAEECSFAGSALTTYQCRLRSGLTFPSGREMTARDVKYSFDRVLRINSKLGPASLLGGLDSVEARGRTLTFRLKSPDATFPFKVATGAGSIVDRTKYPADALRAGHAVDGTGPYTLKGYAAADEAELEPNRAYRGAIGGPGKPIVMRYYADSADLDRAWKAQDVDVASRQLTPGLVAGIRPGSDGARVTESDSSEVRNMVLNVRDGSPFADRRVRQAVASVIDRERLVDTAYSNTVDALYSLVPRGITGHTTSFFDRYSVPSSAKARTLLQEAGASTPVSFTFGYAPGGAAAQEAAEIKRQLETTGLFTVHTKAYEWDDFQRRYADGRLDAYAVGWLADFPDPDTYTAQLVGTGSSLKNGYSSSTVDGLIRATQRFEDRSNATKDLADLQADVARDVPLVPLWQRKDYVLSKPDVTGGQYLDDGTGVYRLWRLGRI